MSWWDFVHFYIHPTLLVFFLFNACHFCPYMEWIYYSLWCMALRKCMGDLGRFVVIHECVFQSHYCVRSALAQNFCQGQGSYILCKRGKYSWVYPAHTSPAVNGSSTLERFERSNAIEIRNGIIFNFYPGLPHMHGLDCACVTLKVFHSLWLLRLCKQDSSSVRSEWG